MRIRNNLTSPTIMQLTPSLVATTAIVCLGSLQFGYHMSELNSPEAVLTCKKDTPGSQPYSDSFWGRNGYESCIPLTDEQFGLVTSIFSIGGLFGSCYVGTIADTIGRRKTALLHCIIYFLGSSLNALSNSVTALTIGRFVAGVGAGSALVVTSLVINEISPNSKKGLLGLMNQVSINIGILFTQLLALGWNNINDWRFLLLTAAGIALLNFVLILAYVDESPVWLVNNGSPNLAFTVLHKLRGGEYGTARNEVNSWKLDDSGLDSAPKGGVTLREYLFSSLFRNSRNVAFGILVLQQFCGINSIIFYGVSVLILTFPTKAVFLNCLISVVNVVVTFGSASIVDKLGRKPLLLTSVSVMGLAAALLGFGIQTLSSLFSIVGTFVYITFFAIGLGPIPFLLVGEVTQPRAKALAQSFGVTMNWVATFVVGFLFPVLRGIMGGATFYIFTAMAGVTFLFVKRVVPETAGKLSYEEVWGVLPLAHD